ncbi:MAG TPA: DUF465 domain-containing protein [Marinobacterium sp.]|nr:DUF465 domain-containing protein [Marinobacterium sp.]
MSEEQHDLIKEFPEFRDQIHTLKVSNKHFAKLFDQYHQVTRDVYKMEAEVEPVTTEIEEEYKKRRLQLKDELHAMLKSAV